MPRTRSFLTIVVLGISLALAACHEEGDIKIASLKLNGVKSVDTEQLANALQTRAGSRLPWGRKRFFDRRAFEADLKRLQAFYRDRGFPDARIASFDVKLNDKQDQVDITVNISEGEPVRVAALEVEGVDVLPEGERKKLLQSMPLQPEQPFDRQLALAARERVVNALRDRGYAYAEVQLHEETVGPKRSKLTLRATPGQLAYFGPVSIAGNKSVDQYVIERQLTYKPGELFKRTEMRESQRKLYRMELFEFANIETSEDRDKQPVQVPTKVTVAEGKHQRLTLGVGYGTEEQARTRIRWDHVNFTGGARHAGFEGKWSSLDRGVRMDFQEPYFFSPHFSLAFRGEAWQAREPVYSANRVGGRFILTHQANSANKWSVSLIDEYQRSSIAPAGLLDFTIRNALISLGLDPRTGEQRGTLSAVAFDVSRTTSNSVLDPRHGYILSWHLEQAGSWLWGDFNYWSTQGEARHYLPMGRRLVLANRLGAGTIDGRGDLEANVPFYKRFFLGGASSLRGWGRFEVSPLSGFGLPIGGHTFLEGSSEARLPAIWGKLGAVAFLDYGNVWPGIFEFGKLRYAVGPGLRYLTPIGPARFDFGWQLAPIDNLRVNGDPEQRHWRVHFSIGQAF